MWETSLGNNCFHVAHDCSGGSYVAAPRCWDQLVPRSPRSWPHSTLPLILEEVFFGLPGAVARFLVYAYTTPHISGRIPLSDRLRPISSIWGHFAGSGRDPEDVRFIDNALKELLAG